MRVYSGRTGAIRFDTAGAQKSSYFGWSVDGVSNLVGSPAEEVFVGSRFELDRGRAHIYNGENGGGGNPWRIHWGFVRSIWFGNSVASAGDVDSDGTNDLIVGSPLHGVLPTDLTQIWGQARVISGATGYTLFNLDGLEHMSWFGHAVSGAGNVNNDCCDDYMVGAPGAAQSRGQVTVFRGSRSSFSAQILGLSVRSGRTQVMLMDAGPAQANRLYFILGTMGGSRPGFPFGGFNIPLNPDSYFFLTVNTIGSGLISGQSGILDSSGRGSALLTVPGGQLPTTLIGYTMQHAYLVFDAQNNLSFVSNPLPAYFEF